MSLKISFSKLFSTLIPSIPENCHQTNQCLNLVRNQWQPFWHKSLSFILTKVYYHLHRNIKVYTMLLLLVLLIRICPSSTYTITAIVPWFQSFQFVNLLNFVQTFVAFSFISSSFLIFATLLGFLVIFIVSFFFLTINQQSYFCSPPAPSVVDNCYENLNRSSLLHLSKQNHFLGSSFNDFYIQFELNLLSADGDTAAAFKMSLPNGQSSKCSKLDTTLSSSSILPLESFHKNFPKTAISAKRRYNSVSRGSWSCWQILSYDLYCSAFLLLLVGLLFSPIKGTIRPSCRCVIFDDTFGKEYGIFTSPNWPVPYESSIECLLYTFVAAPDQIVEITFDEFDVQKNSDVECEYGDYIKLYLHLNLYGAITERTLQSAIMCGKFPDIEQTHYSSNSTLMFEFHSDWRSGNNTGFRGTFRFLNKLLFHTDGQLVPNTVCDYLFVHPAKTDSTAAGSSFELARKIHSIEENEASEVEAEYRQKSLLTARDNHNGDSNYSNQHSHNGSLGEPMLSAESNPVGSLRALSPNDYSYQQQQQQNRYRMSFKNQSRSTSGTPQSHSRTFVERGHFYSPQYPSTYPKNTRCSFTFRADRNQRVRLLFVDVSLQKVDQSCIESPDLINIYDGISTKSDLIGQICGQSSYLELLSSSNFAFVQFNAKSHISARGFKAEYAFVSTTPTSPPGSSTANGTGAGLITNPTHPFQSLPPPSGGFETDPSITTTSCDQWFSSDQAINGTLTSPNYPLPYPANIKCQYHFIGRGKERVQIIFQEFDVHKVEDQHRDCETSDSVTAYITTNGQKEWIDDFCGSEIPPQIMSNGHRLTIEFKSLGHNKLSTSSGGSSSGVSAFSSKRKNGDAGIQTNNNKKNKTGRGNKASKQKHHQFLKSKSKSYPNFPVEEASASALSSFAMQQQNQPATLHQQIRSDKSEIFLYNSKINYATRPAKRSANSRNSQLAIATVTDNTAAAIPDKSEQVGPDKSVMQQTTRSVTRLADYDNHNRQQQPIANFERRENKGAENLFHFLGDESGDDDYKEEDEEEDEEEELRSRKERLGLNLGPTPNKKNSNIDSSNRHQSKGFRAIYRFVTNFGIETGKQDSKSVCGFVFNSTETKNGTFTSPNYPGLYPKDTECHYFFYGNSTERVHIVFTNFDVEGVKPCTLETASDYVEFSNFYSADRKMYRHCGLKHPKSVESEGDFFRVTFKSNGRFDGTGFKAIYTFKINEGYQIKKIRSSVSTSMSTSSAFSTLVVASISSWLSLIIIVQLLFH